MSNGSGKMPELGQNAVNNARKSLIIERRLYV